MQCSWLGNCLIYSYARSLQMLCLSSGEAEFNGGVAACSEGIFTKEIFGFVGSPLKMEVYLDSSAARGVFQRQGVGRIRHLEVKSLWVQEALQRKLFSLHAVPSQENTADFGTKALAVKRFVELRQKIGIGSYEMVEKQPMIQDKENYKSVAAVSAVGNGMTRHALMVALLTLLQSAESFEIELNVEKNDWVFTDLGLGICVVLMLQSLMLWFFFKCITRHFQVHATLSLGTKQVQTAEKGVDCEINTWSSKVYHLEGRDVFHVDTTCPRLGQRSRSFDALRLCMQGL